MKRVEVTWVDSAGVEGWKSRDETTAPVRCRSVGYVVERNADKIVLAQSQTSEQINGLFAIPVVAVKKIRRLREC